MEKKTLAKFHVLAIICIIIFSAVLAPKILQNDTYYTISIGEHVIENGIDGKDPFSWSDLNYTYPHWLYDVCIYLIYSVGGMTGIYISTVVLSCILGLLLYITNVKVNKKPLFAFIITIGVMFLMQDFIAARAQLVTFILFVVEILLVECFLDTKKKRYVIGLMLIAMLIANLHAAVFYFFFILLLPYIAEYYVIKLRDAHLIYRFRLYNLKYKINSLSKKNNQEEKLVKLQEKLVIIEEKFVRLKKRLDEREEKPYRIKLVRRDAAKWLILIFVLCFLMGLITPLGDEPYTHLFKLMSGTTTQSISEHLPLTLVNHMGAMTVIVMLIIILVFTDTKASIKDLCMIGGLLLLTFMSRRQFSMLVTIGGISFTALMCDFVDKYDKEGIKEFTKLAVTWKGKIVTILLIVLCSYMLYIDKIDDPYINSASYPVAAADYILEEVEKGNLDLETMRLYNDYNYGSYLLFRGIPVFIDSRADLYSPEFNEGCNIFSDYLNISGIATYYEDAFDKYGITHIMSYANSKLTMLLSRDENYNKLYEDDYFVIYERLSVNVSDE